MAVLDSGQARADFWRLAAGYIALDTSIRQGNGAVEGFVREVLASAAPRLRVQHGTLAGKPQVNVLASFGPDAPGGLLLVTHSDTVLPGPLDRWTEGPPHTLTTAGDRVVGLGVADVKLDYLCKAFALRSLDHRTLRKPVHLLATYGEEVGLVGAKAFVAAGLCAPDWVMCGEPSELLPCHAHKGYAMCKVRAQVREPKPMHANLRLEMRGKAAHSSTPHLGQNAIMMLCETLARVPTAAVSTIDGGSSPNTVPALATARVRADAAAFAGRAELSSKAEDASGFDLSPALSALSRLWRDWAHLGAALAPAHDSEFDPDHVVCNWNVLGAEPSALTATFDARLLPAHDPASMHAAFATAVKGAAVPGLDIALGVERDSGGMRLDRKDPLLVALCDTLREAGLPATPKAKATSTEAGVFFRTGASACVFGPGTSTGNAHAANEWNSIEDVERAVDIYAALVKKLCC